MIGNDLTDGIPRTQAPNPAARYHDSSAMTRMVVAAMRDLGLDADRFMAQFGLDSKRLDERDRRTLHERVPDFWARLESETGDSNIGLHLGQHIPTFGGEVLEYLFLSSETFGEGLNRALRYQALLSGAGLGQLTVDGPAAVLTLDSALARVNADRHLYECLTQGIVRFFRSVTDNAFAPQAVTFVAPAPASTDDAEAVFGCPIAYGAAHNTLTFDASVLQRASPHAEPRLVTMHERVAAERLRELNATDFAIATRRAIAAELEAGTPSLSRVAARLDVTERELRSRLSAAETSFNRELDGYRERLACRLLARTDQPIDEIVYLTGFSEPSTFYRAFRRWRDETPVHYRRRMRQTHSNDGNVVRD